MLHSAVEDVKCPAQTEYFPDTALNYMSNVQCRHSIFLDTALNYTVVECQMFSADIVFPLILH